MRPVEPRDLLRYRFLSEPQFAPGGRRASFVVSRCDEEKNGYASELWLREGGELRKLVDLRKGSHCLWLDARRMLICSPREGRTICEALDVESGKIEPLFELPFALRQILMLDENHFAATATIDANHPDGEPAEPTPGWEVLDELPFWSNGVGFTNKRREALFLIRREPWNLRRVTAPLEHACGMAKLNGELYYNVRSHEAKEFRRGFRVRALNWISGEDRLVAEDEIVGVEQMLSVGEELWLVGSDHRRHGRNENPWFYRLRPDGEFALLRADEASAEPSVGADCRYGGGTARAAKGGALYTLATHGGSALLDRVKSDGSRETVIDRPGSIDSFAICEESGEALLVALYDMRPQELYSYNFESGKMRRLSHFNDDAISGRYIAEPRPLRLQSAGAEVEGWVLPPIDFDANKSYPGILLIHGGPKTVYGAVFVHEMQLWAGLGYFVFYCNPRGSDGGDNAFMDIRGHYGEADYRNVMDFTDAVLNAYPQIDPERLCVTGGSYGGFLTNWIIGHTDRFCCAASQRSICNWISCYGVSDIGPSFVREETGTAPYIDPEKMWEKSPLRYAGAVVTPTLFLHSDADYRCPMDQSLQMYTALMDRGVPSRMVLFHGEDHDLCRQGRPKNRLYRLKEITDWFERYARERKEAPR